MFQGSVPLISYLVSIGLLTPQQAELCGALVLENKAKVLEVLVHRGFLTEWQANQLHLGRTRALFLGDFKLLEPLGAGGMGQVFRAMKTARPSQSPSPVLYWVKSSEPEVHAGTEVAVKILSRRAATGDGVRRFRREALAELRIAHGNIVRCFELGQQGDIQFIVMELVRGTDLRDRSTRVAQRSDTLRKAGFAWRHLLIGG